MLICQPYTGGQDNLDNLESLDNLDNLEKKSDQRDISGGYCGGVPPLPIPNREVKPACADGTAMQCGRVGGRHLFLGSPDSAMSQGSFVFLD